MERERLFCLLYDRRGFGPVSNVSDLAPDSLFSLHHTVLTVLCSSSNMLRAYSRDNNDRYYDLSYSGQVHRRRSASLPFLIRDA